MSLLYPPPKGTGCHPLITRAESGLAYLEFGLLRLEPGGRHQFRFPGVEAALVILGGKCTLWGEGFRWPEVGERGNVFEGKATAAYLPAGCEVEVEAVSPLELAVCTAPAGPGGRPVLVTPDQVATRTVGVKNWQREVQGIILTNVPAQRLMVGETCNLPGCWSSYPPHKHDVDRLPEEVKLEEVYHFRVQPEQGFGIQRIYSPESGLEECYAVGQGDTVVIPRGYHPVAAAPGYALYYLWMLAGETRVMKPNDDPAHAWVKTLER